MEKTSSKRDLAAIEKEIAETKAALADVHGTPTEVYARIVGYYRAVRNWNKGKRDEFDHRRMFDVNTKSSIYMTTPADTSCCSVPAEPVQIPVQQEVSESGIASYEFYARKTCPNCPPVKAYLADITLPGTMIDVDTKEGLAQAAQKGVFAAPTVIFYDAAGQEIARGHNVEELSVIQQPAIAVAV